MAKVAAKVELSNTQQLASQVEVCLIRSVEMGRGDMKAFEKHEIRQSPGQTQAGRWRSV